MFQIDLYLIIIEGNLPEVVTQLAQWSPNGFDSSPRLIYSTVIFCKQLSQDENL